MKRLIISGGLAGLVAVALTVIAVAQFIDAHVASGDVSTANSTSDLLYICQPSGTTVSPQCPVDTAAGDESIFVGPEELIAGSVRWQKIRVRNTSTTEPWDLLSMSSTMTEVSDPGGTCDTLPEGVRWAGQTLLHYPIGPGVTLLGQSPSVNFNGGSGARDPINNLYYNPYSDNHGVGVGTSSATFLNMDANAQVVHIAPQSYEDLLLGIRLSVSTPVDCLNVVWQISTNWSVQVHTP